MRIVECGVWSVQCEGKSVGRKVWSGELGLWSLKCGVACVKCRVGSGLCGV